MINRRKKPAARKSRKKTDRPEEPAESSTTASFTESELIRAWFCSGNESLLHLVYTPASDCFFQGEDPLYSVRQLPGFVAGSLSFQGDGAAAEGFDPFQCQTRFSLLTQASETEIREHFRYVPEQIELTPLAEELFPVLRGDIQASAVSEETADDLCKAAEQNDSSKLMALTDATLELLNPDLKVAAALRWLKAATDASDTVRQQRCLQELRDLLQLPQWTFAEPAAPVAAASKSDSSRNLRLELARDDEDALQQILTTQKRLLEKDTRDVWSAGRIASAVNVIRNALIAMQKDDDLRRLDSAMEQALQVQPAALAAELDVLTVAADVSPENTVSATATPATVASTADNAQISDDAGDDTDDEESDDEEINDHAMADDTVPVVQHVQKAADITPAKTSAELNDNLTASVQSGSSRSVKVDQEKIDRLMNLIGEMVVAKNALPYLARRAEEEHGLRDLGRDIKEQFAVINRIAEEMQDSIMQIRMMPFSFITMRFPRLVRDISRRLNKNVQLMIEGEDTEADKNIIESLAEPLIHILRNSLDHGIEAPEVRRKAGKPAAGTLTIKASQEADRVLIEIHDDGKGIDPEVIKQKALEKGLIDDAAFQRLTNREAINLVLIPGFSTASEVSDLSGRGVGMDAVRCAVEKVNGSMALDSEAGKGTRIRISLPMSIAVTRVMIVESDNQLLGIPMDQVLETVRVPATDIHTVKSIQTTVLRERIVPLRSLNNLLAIDASQRMNEDNECAVLVVRVGIDVIGLIVDNFRGSADIIQKPMTGVLNGLRAYSGAALIGDGSVLMILNLKEIL
ncbi:MAG: chemotaxis protein CheA [Saccharospirillaceae bacterium]|nr:chemotaxis protein CheA [Saccharospirillaceae bacterium]